MQCSAKALEKWGQMTHTIEKYGDIGNFSGVTAVILPFMNLKYVGTLAPSAKIIGDIPDFNVLNVPKTQPRHNPEDDILCMVNSIPLPFTYWIFHRKHKNVSTIYIIPPHWYGTGSWNPLASETRTYLFYIVNIRDANIQFSKCLMILRHSQKKMLNIWLNGKEFSNFLLNFHNFLCTHNAKMKIPGAKMSND